MTAIDWQKLTQPEFDRRVEAFYKVEHDDAEAFAVNGRGGDSGIDFHIKKNGVLTIVQLKFFPEGFSGGFKRTRREQIEKSYASAIQHKPATWQIVIPATLRMDERLFLLNLGGKVRDKPTIEIVDLNDLDVLSSRHPGLADLFETSVLEKNAQTKYQAAALSIDMDEIVAQFKRLDHHLDSLDPDWRADLIQRGGETIRVISPKHPFAYETSPINISLRTDFGSEHAGLQRSFEQAMRFGTDQRIDLPPAVVSRFTVTGPAFVAHESESVGVSLIPLDYTGPSYPLELRFVDAGSVVSSHHGTTDRIASAAEGANLRANFYGAVSTQFLLPADEVASGAMNIGLDFAGADPSDIVASTDLIADLQSGLPLELHLDGRRLCTMQFTSPTTNTFAADRDQIAMFRTVAEDLEVVQRHTRQRFPMPDEVSGLDRANLRFLRLLIDGKCVVLPGIHELTLTLNGSSDEGLLSMMRGPVQLFSTRDEFTWPIFGRELRLGAHNVMAPQVKAVDGEAAIAALEAGEGAGRELTMKTLRGLGFWYMLREHWPTEGDTPIRPSRWGLAGIDDPPDVEMYAEGSDRQIST